MAYTLLKYKDKFDLEIKEYQVSLIADIDGLPNAASTSERCGVGSSCFCEENEGLYILCVDGVTWKLL